MRRAVKVALLSTLFLAYAGSANAILYGFTGSLSAAKEFPVNASLGTGSVVVWWDTTTHLMQVSSTFSGLTSGTTAAHIHCCTGTAFDFTATAPVATQTPSFIGFPLGVTSGSFANTYDMTLASSYRAGFITANGGTVGTAEAALLQGLIDGKAYFNIHTTINGGGEIRDFLAAVPEPGTLSLFGVGLAYLASRRLRRRAPAAA